MCWWQRTCSRTGCDSCCRSSFKTVTLSKEAWQINKTKCKICFFSVDQELQFFQKAWGLYRCFLPHYVHLLYDWIKVFPLTCSLLSFKFCVTPCYYSDRSDNSSLFNDEFTDMSIMFIWLLWMVKRDYKSLREKPCLFLMPQEVSFLKEGLSVEAIFLLGLADTSS